MALAVVRDGRPLTLDVRVGELDLEAEAGAALDAVGPGRTAFLLVQRSDSRVFLQLRKAS